MTHRFAVSALTFVLLSAVVPAAAQQPDEETFESDNFSITLLAGSASPEAIDETLEAFEDARSFLLGALGYLAPPVDGKYQLFVAEFGQPVSRRAPGGIGGRDPSFIVIPRSFVGAGQDLRLAAVHEYFHAIQYGYDGESEAWIREASSAWIEALYAESPFANAGYLPAFVPFPRMPLDSGGGLHPYGAFLFVQYLVERLESVDIVKELWEEMAVPAAVPGAPNESPVAAITTVIGRRGLTLDQAWGEFQLWRLRLPQNFVYGVEYARVLRDSDWPSFLRTTKVRSDSCRLDGNEDGFGLPPLSGDYVRLRPARRGPARATARLAVDGPPGTAGFYVIDRRGRGPAIEHLLSFDADGVGIAEVPFGRRAINRITVGLANASAPGAAAIGYSLRLRGENRVTLSPPSGVSATNFGTGVILSGSVECRGRPAPFADVLITVREIVSGEEQVFEVETNEFGRWSLGFTPEANSRIIAEVIDPLLSSARSEPFDVEVRVVVTLEVGQARIPQGTPVVLSGEIQPPHGGVEIVAEYRRPSGPWNLGTTVTSDPSGRYSAQFTLPNTGIWEVRTRVDDTGDEDHIGNTSGIRLVDVID